MLDRRTVFRTLGMLGAFGCIMVAAGARAEGRLRVEESVELAASPAQVWSAIGDFNGLSGWHPAVASSEIVKGRDNRRGAVRAITTKDGAKLVEELLAYDASRRSMRYRIVDSPLPVADYVSTLSVERAGRGSRIVWKSAFDRAAAATDVDDAKAREIVSGIYVAGFAGLRKVLDETAPAVQ